MASTHDHRARMFGLAGHAHSYQYSAGRFAGRMYDRVAADVAAAGLADGARVLDVGTGPGLVPLRIAALCPGLRIEAIDLAPEMIEQAHRNAAAAGPAAGSPAAGSSAAGSAVAGTAVAGSPAARSSAAGSSEAGSSMAGVSEVGSVEVGPPVAGVSAVTFSVGDVVQLPFPDASFDLVVSSISQHHWADPQAGLREIARVLRPGAQAWIYDFRVLALSRAQRAARGLGPGVSVTRQSRLPGASRFSMIGRLVLISQP
jgi:SAM-dependent methyltransferase